MHVLPSKMILWPYNYVYDDWKYSKHDNIHADLCISQTNSSVNFPGHLLCHSKYSYTQQENNGELHRSSFQIILIVSPNYILPVTNSP